ncbi:enoyl-CoA hydratase-related protein [Kribbella sancticallisti]|uniref:Enoyl-CoA hydratase-related protein n=1 Tax=Kribbella sancticallisti TaxID=460087 RepID=A0ABN2CMJ0_9ACTN
MTSRIRYRGAGGAAYITLARPDRRNSLDLATLDELGRSVRRARADDVRVVVLAADGDAFSVGGDLVAIAAADDREQYVEDLAETLHRAITELHNLEAVVVSVVTGVAAGAGVALAAAADVVLAAHSARFSIAYTKVGLSPDGGTSLLSASLGLHRALYLALLNPLLTAEEAMTAGLVAEVHPDDELPAAVERVVGTLLTGSRTAQVVAKRLLRCASSPDPAWVMRREALTIRAAVGSADAQEGIAAFLDKRRPRFPSAGGSSAGDAG